MAQIHYLHQCWDIVNRALRLKRQIFFRNPYIFIQENVFEHAVCKTVVILSRPQIVKNVYTETTKQMSHVTMCACYMTYAAHELLLYVLFESTNLYVVTFTPLLPLAYGTHCIYFKIELKSTNPCSIFYPDIALFTEICPDIMSSTLSLNLKIACNPYR